MSADQSSYHERVTALVHRFAEAAEVTSARLAASPDPDRALHDLFRQDCLVAVYPDETERGGYGLVWVKAAHLAEADRMIEDDRLAFLLCESRDVAVRLLVCHGDAWPDTERAIAGLSRHDATDAEVERFIEQRVAEVAAEYPRNFVESLALGIMASDLEEAEHPYGPAGVQ